MYTHTHKHTYSVYSYMYLHIYHAIAFQDHLETLKWMNSDVWVNLDF